MEFTGEPSVVFPRLPAHWKSLKVRYDPHHLPPLPVLDPGVLLAIGRDHQHRMSLAQVGDKVLVYGSLRSLTRAGLCGKLHQLLSDLGTNNLFSHLALSYNLHTLLGPGNIYNRHTPQKFSADIFEAYIGALWLRARQSPRDKWQQEKAILRWIDRLYGQPVWPVVDEWTEQTRQVLLANSGVKVEPMTPRPRVHSGTGTKGNPWVVDTPIASVTLCGPPTFTDQSCAATLTQWTSTDSHARDDVSLNDTPWRPPTPPGLPPPTEPPNRTVAVYLEQTPSRAAPIESARDSLPWVSEKEQADVDDQNEWEDLDWDDMKGVATASAFSQAQYGARHVTSFAPAVSSATPTPKVHSKRKLPEEADLRQVLFARKLAKQAHTDRPTLAERIGFDNPNVRIAPTRCSDGEPADGNQSRTPPKDLGARMTSPTGMVPGPPIGPALFTPVKSTVTRSPKHSSHTPPIRSKAAAVLSAVKRVKKLVRVVRQSSSNVKMATPGKGSPRGRGSFATRFGLGGQERIIGSPLRFARGTPLKYHKLG